MFCVSYLQCIQHLKNCSQDKTTFNFNRITQKHCFVQALIINNFCIKSHNIILSNGHCLPLDYNFSTVWCDRAYFYYQHIRQITFFMRTAHEGSRIEYKYLTIYHSMSIQTRNE